MMIHACDRSAKVRQRRHSCPVFQHRAMALGLASYCDKGCLKANMSAKKVGPDNKPGFNYIVCLDIVVLACIVVVAGRPDGLAITVSAIIVAVAALVYRGSIGVKSYMSKKPGNSSAQVRQHGRSANPKVNKAPTETAVRDRANSTSWLRETE